MKRLLPFLPLVLVLACDGRDPFYSRSQEFQWAPVEADGAVVFLDPALGRIAVVRPAGTGVAPFFIPYSGEPRKLEVAPDGKALLLLDIARTMLTRVGLADGTTVDFPLPTAFTGLNLSADAKAALLHHELASGSSSAMVNAAEIALVDLTAPAAEAKNPRTATIAGLSQPPVAAFVSPAVQVGDVHHRVAWIEAVSVIGVADFGPTGSPRTVVIPLAPPDSGAVITPFKRTAIAFPGGLDLYLLAKGSNDVIHLTLDLTGAQIGVSIDQLASGASPADLYLFDGADGLRCLAVNAGSRDLALLDPRTGTGTVVSLDRAADAILPFSTAVGNRRALLWLSAARGSSIQVADLDALPKKKGKAVDVVEVGRDISRIVPAGDNGTFLLVHPAADVGLSVFDGDTMKTTAFGGTGTVSDVRIVEGAAFLLGSVSGLSRLSRLDLATLHATSLTVNPPAQHLAAIGTSGACLIGRGLGGWWLAAFPQGVLEAEKGVYVEGFTLADLL